MEEALGLGTWLTPLSAGAGAVRLVVLGLGTGMGLLLLFLFASRFEPKAEPSPRFLNREVIAYKEEWMVEDKEKIDRRIWREGMRFLTLYKPATQMGPTHQ